MILNKHVETTSRSILCKCKVLEQRETTDLKSHLVRAEGVCVEMGIQDKDWRNNVIFLVVLSTWNVCLAVV